MFQSAVKFFVIFSITFIPSFALAEDCNENGISDLVDISSTKVTTSELARSQAFSGIRSTSAWKDINGDGHRDLVEYGAENLRIFLGREDLSFERVLYLEGRLAAGFNISYTTAGVGNFKNNESKNLVYGYLYARHAMSPRPPLNVSRRTIGFYIMDIPSEDPLPDSNFIHPLRHHGESLNFSFDESSSISRFPSSEPRSIVVGDFNNDNHTDFAFLVFDDGEDHLVRAFNSGNGIDYTAIGTPLGSRATRLLLDDNGINIRTLEGRVVDETTINSDTTISLISDQERYRAFLEVKRKSGRITESYPLGFSVGKAGSFDTGPIHAVDYDNDEDIDLLVVGPYSHALLVNDGNDRFNLRTTIAGPSEGFILNAVTDSLTTFLFRSSEQDEFVVAELSNEQDELNTPTSLDKNANSIPDECERAIAGDYDGDRRTDFAVAREFLDGWYWFINQSTDGPTEPIQFGLATPQFYDGIYAGDYDGDGKIEPGVVRTVGDGLYWFSRNTDGSATMVQWGLRGDQVLTGHFDTDNKLDRAVVRDIGAYRYWFIRRSNDDNLIAINWGLSRGEPGVGQKDEAFTGDVDGDGIDELIVARKTNSGDIAWYSRRVSGAVLDVRFHGNWKLGDRAIKPLDLTGNGEDDLLVVRSTTTPLQAIPSLLISQRRALDVRSVEYPDFPGTVVQLGNYSQTQFAEVASSSLLSNSLELGNIAPDIQDSFKYGLFFDWVVKPDGTAEKP